MKASNLDEVLVYFNASLQISCNPGLLSGNKHHAHECGAG
jgi:hypothetical protein